MCLSVHVYVGTTYNDLHQICFSFSENLKYTIFGILVLGPQTFWDLCISCQVGTGTLSNVLDQEMNHKKTYCT